MDPVSPRQDRGGAPVNTVHSRKYNTDKTHVSSLTYYWHYLKDFIHHYFKMRVDFKMVKIKVLHSLRF